MKRVNKTPKTITPLKAIRQKCLDCCVGQRKEVKRCLIDDCPLFPFRMGRNPFRKRKILKENEKKLF